MDYSYGFGWPYGEIDDYIDASGIADIDTPLLRQNNLSDVYDAAAARTNIEAMYGGNNLSEITNPTQARLNLGITSSSGTMSGYGFDVLENGDWNDLNTNYPASGYLDQVAFVKTKTTTLLGLVTTKQDGLYISDGTTWNKTNLQVQFFDDSLEFIDDVDNSKTMKFQLSDISPSGTTILNIPNESGTIARIEDLSALGYGFDIIEEGNKTALDYNYPAASHSGKSALVKTKWTAGSNIIAQDGIYISDGSSWNKANLANEFKDNKFKIRNWIDNERILEFTLDEVDVSKTIKLNIPNESGTIARIEDLSSIPAPTGALLIESNLSDLENTSIARDNLGLGNVATADFGITSITVASGDHLHSIYQQTSEKGIADGYASLDSDGLVPSAQLPASIGSSGDLLSANNLFDLSDIPTARDNLGLGNVATADFGITSATAASGDHLHSIYQQTSEKGIADGYASLDGSGLIPYNQIPSGIHSNLQNLNWSSAGHTIDSNVDFNNNSASGLSTTQFNTNYVITRNEEVGESYWDSAENTFSDVLGGGVIGQRYKELFTDGQNNTGQTILNGSPVEYDDSIGNSGNFRIKLAKAEATKPTFYFIGLATQEISNASSGKISTHGKVRGIQTNGANYGESWNDGDVIYLSGTIAGYLTNIMPEAPIPAIKVGVIISAHASNGTLEIKQSYPERLSELSDVNGTPLSSDGQIPVWHNGSGYFDFTENIYNYQTISGKGIANGYASLGADGLVPSNQLPTSISSSGDLLAANNLFDLDNIVTARNNLGLSAVAIAEFGKTSTTVASGDHLHSQYLTSTTLGNMSLQDSQNVNISGGIINGVNIGVNNAGFIASTGINITGNANFPLTHLADGTTINTNCASGNNFVVTLGGDRTLANPTSLSEGVYNWIVKQDGTGGRTLAFGNKFQFAPSGAPTLSTAPSAMDVISGIYDNQAKQIICSYVLSGE